MDNDRKISMIINTAAALIMLLVVLILLLIYSDNICYRLAGDKSAAENDGGILSVSASGSESDSNMSNRQIFLPDITESDQYGEKPENPAPPKSDFMQYMFDNAIPIPGSHNKIEPPPAGRSAETQYGAVPLSDTIPDPCEYFKNSIFIGDSVTSGFDLYKSRIKFNGENVLSETSVAAVGNYRVYFALQPVSGNTVHPLMNGVQALPEDIIAQKNVKNVFICLGLNDLTAVSPSDFVTYYSQLISRIKAKSPDKNIAIMSVTPLVSGKSRYDLTNDSIIEANNALLEFAKANGVYFIDYAAAVRDSQNCLPADLSSDDYCHLIPAAYDMLVEYMLYHPIK